MPMTRLLLLCFLVLLFSPVTYGQDNPSPPPFDITFSVASHNFSFGEARSLFSQLTGVLRAGGPRPGTPEGYPDHPIYDIRVRFKYTDIYTIGAAASFTRSSIYSEASSSTHVASLSGNVKMASFRLVHRLDFYRPKLLTPFVTAETGFLFGSVRYAGLTEFLTTNRTPVVDNIKGSGTSYDVTGGFGLRFQPGRFFLEGATTWKYARITDAIITTARDNSASSSQDIPFELDFSGFILQLSMGIVLF